MDTEDRCFVLGALMPATTNAPSALASSRAEVRINLVEVAAREVSALVEVAACEVSALVEVAACKVSALVEVAARKVTALVEAIALEPMLLASQAALMLSCLVESTV
jgi:hypothetical protein